MSINFKGITTYGIEDLKENASISPFEPPFNAKWTSWYTKIFSCTAMLGFLIPHNT